MLGVILMLGALWTTEWLVPKAAKQHIEELGFGLDASQFDVNLRHGRIRASDLVLKNPEEWPESEFVVVNNLILDIDGGTWRDGKELVFDVVVIDIGSLSYVTNEERESNAALLVQRAEEVLRRQQMEGVSDRPFRIEQFRLKIDQLRVADYSGAQPRVKTVPLNVDVRLENVTDASQILLPAVSGLTPEQMQELGAALAYSAGTFDAGELMRMSAEGMLFQGDSASRAGKSVGEAIERLKGLFPALGK